MPRLIRPLSCIALILVPTLSIFAFLLPPWNIRTAKLLHAAANASSLVSVHAQGQPFPTPPFTIYSTRVVLPEVAEPTSAYLSVDRDGTIASVSSSLLGVASHLRSRIIDVSPLVVMPGLIDPHVHVNSPGKDHWEGFATAMRAAASGGTTTMLDMPINSMPATVDLSSHARKLDALMHSPAIVNVGLIGGVVPENVHNLSDLLNVGVVALKSFLVDTQSPDFKMVSTQDLRTAVAFLHQWHTAHHISSERYIPYILHAELDDFAERTGSRVSGLDDFDHMSFNYYEASRPVTWETAATAEAISAVNGSQVQIHIAHVSAVQVIDQIRKARKQGLNGAVISAETTSHYLVFDKADIPAGNTLYKCSPPIRDFDNQQRLVKELFDTYPEEERVVDIVVSDHSPCENKLKETEGNITAAWGGIAGLQYRLHSTAKAAFDANQSVVDISRVLSADVARLFHLDSVKGSFEPGKDADIVIWDPEKLYIVSPDKCEHRVKASAFDGWELRGDVQYTLVRGHVVFEQESSGRRRFEEGHGRYLQRETDGQIKQDVLQTSHSDGES